MKDGVGVKKHEARVCWENLQTKGGKGTVWRDRWDETIAFENWGDRVPNERIDSYKLLGGVALQAC